ncbi:hypothetical protein GGS20DRAFT_581506 [Poronia punctata]|nr:hypothetical protein GGS20DRAFT_581506 [Poronia punctata]
MEEYRQYLAQKILTEDQVVTYRLLSRALKVHVNTAKEMLYDFHQWQNAKRPGTMHATYLLYGTKSEPQGEKDDEDVKMTDSQTSDEADSSSYSDTVPNYTLSLVREEDLQEELKSYSQVTSIHVYSLAPHPLKDLQLLADTARQVLKLSQEDTTPNPAKVYGTIVSPNVRRRERKAVAGVVPAVKAPAQEPKQEQKKPVVKQEAKHAPVSQATVKKEESKPTSSKASASASASAPVKKSAAAAATAAASLKRQGSSGIGEMFAKQAAKPKKPAAAVKKSESPAPDATALSDDGEDDTEEPMPDVKQEESSATRQARRARQAELQRMMEESDEEEEAGEEEEEDKAEEAEAEADAMEVDQEQEEPSKVKEEEKEQEEPAEVVSSTGDGRRRGRRRVMRKKQIMDEKGYLVTIQEPGWESFSEDEAPPPPPTKAKQQKQAPAKTESAAKGKKGASNKAGQGNIMSFFSKK